MNFHQAESPLLLLGAMDAYDSGHVAGQAFVWMLLVAGALKCWAISHRASTNRKCALSLMLVLLGMVAGGLGGALSKAMAHSVLTTLAFGATFILLLGLVVASIILAILGLTEFSREKGVYVQGRKQAVWALVLSGVMVIAGVTGFVRGLLRNREPAFTSGPSSPGQLLTFEEYNFRFRSPDRPWASLNAAKINKDSKLGFLRRSPDAYFFLIPERLGLREDFSTERLVEVGKAHLNGIADTNYVISEAPFRLNGLLGTLVETETRLAQHHFYYLHWYFVTNGFAYQLIGYGRFEDHQRLAGDLRNLFQHFELIDPSRTAESGAGGYKTNFASAHFNYSVQVAQSPWHPAAELQREVAEAEFSASRGDSCFVVIPVWLGSEAVDPEALTAGMLSIFGAAYPGENLTERKNLAEGGLSGVQYDFSRAVEGTPVKYRFKILQEGSDAYMLAAWTQRRTNDAELLLADATSRVTFRPRSRILLSALPTFTAREHKTRAQVFNQAGLFHYEAGEYEKALPLFRAATSADPSERVHAINALLAWKSLDRPREALDFITQQPEALRTHPEVRAWQAHFQADASQTETALTNFARLFTEGFRNEARFAEYVELLNAGQEHDRALAAIENYLKQGESVAVRVLEAEEYRLKKDLPRSLELLKKQHERAPFNAAVTGPLVETSLEAEKYQEALALSKEMVRANNDSAYAHYLQGRSELALKWFREAKTSFEQAAKQAPASKDIRSYLDHVSGLLGEGDNSAIKEPLAAVAVPAVLTNRTQEPPPEGYAKSYGGYYSRRLVAVSFEPGKEYKTTEYLQARVLDVSGVAALSTLQRVFDPLAEQLFVNELTVLDSDGKTISTGKVADYYALDDHLGSGASQKKVLNIPVPGLQPGCQLALTITRREFGHLDQFPFLEHCFSRSLPVRDSMVFVRGDCAGLKSVTSPSLEPTQIAEGRYWLVIEPAVMRWEPLQPPMTTFLPTVWISDASRQWPAVVSNYLASISDRLAPDPAIAERARNLVATLKDEDAKITALVRYLQTNFTYKAIEFGRRARVPNKPAEIIRNKYGDCKDHAVLLQQMLEAIGVPARLALVSHSGPVHKELPSLDQFDHMVVYLPGAGGRFVDSTDKGADAAHAIPYGLAGHDALILERDEPRFISIPTYPDQASSISIKQELRLVDDEDLAVEENLTFIGPHAAFLRDFFLQTPLASQRQSLQRQMGLGDVELKELKAESVDEPERPLVLRCSYLRKKQFHRVSDGLSGTLKAGLAREYLAAGAVDGRTTPFEITIPTSVRLQVSLTLPGRFRAEPPTPGTRKLDDRFAECQARWRTDGGVLSLDFECRQAGGKFKPTDYPAYHETMTQALSLLEREIVLKEIVR